MTVASTEFLSSPSCAVRGQKGGNMAASLNVRDKFPILKANPDTLFFDSAATSQKPLSVLDKIDEFNRVICANAGRGAYSWSTRLSGDVANARASVAKFLNSTFDLVAFTGGATDSLNLVAMMWGLQNLTDGDQVMLCQDDHASSVLPWYNLQDHLRHRGINIEIVLFEMHHTGTYDRKSVQRGLSSKTRIVCLSHIHHLYGMEMDIAELKADIPEHVFVSLDASQSVSHIKVDSQALGVDFISFSGHKMFAANGTGVLWTSERALAQMSPMQVGAKTKVDFSSGKFAIDKSRLSNLVECGTLNLPGILSIGAAIDFIDCCGLDRIGEYVSKLTRYLHDQLKKIDNIEFAPGIGVCDCTKGFGIISFKFNGVDSGDVGAYLDSEEILVKTGDQCLGNGKSTDDFIRVSLQIYNTIEEIDRFVEVLREAICN